MRSVAVRVFLVLGLMGAFLCPAAKAQAVDLFDWASYLGAESFDAGYSVATDADGNAWIAIYTCSLNMPTPGGFQTAKSGSCDAYVAKVTPDGQLAWASYLGGNGNDVPYGIAVDAAGNAWVVGLTLSTDFPTTGGFQTTKAGSVDAFVAKITPSGILAWSSYLGGSGYEFARNVAIDSGGNAWVVGYTDSTNFPTPGGFQTTINGGADFFITKITPGGTIAWGTFLGGSGGDYAMGIDVDSSGNVWVCGYSFSADWPTPGGFQTTSSGPYDYDGVIAKITPSGTLDWGSYLGGNNTDLLFDVAVGPSGDVWVTGYTWSTNLLTPGGFQTTNAGGYDAYVARISGGALAWASYLGGSGYDLAYGLDVDTDGNAWVTGSTASYNFPVLDGFQTTIANRTDAFAVRITPAGVFDYGTFIGGNSSDIGMAIAADSDGSAWIVGYTGSTDLPTDGGFQPVKDGSTDAFIVKLGGVEIEVDVDIKPGSADNAINLSSAGVIPVAILSTEDFDATTVNPATVALAGAAIKLAGKSGKWLASEEDVNGDGLVDLLCKINTNELALEVGDTMAGLVGETYDGTPIFGEAYIIIVK